MHLESGLIAAVESVRAPEALAELSMLYGLMGEYGVIDEAGGLRCPGAALLYAPPSAGGGVSSAWHRAPPDACAGPFTSPTSCSGPCIT